MYNPYPSPRQLSYRVGGSDRFGLAEEGWVVGRRGRASILLAILCLLGGLLVPARSRAGPGSAKYRIPSRWSADPPPGAPHAIAGWAGGGAYFNLRRAPAAHAPSVGQVRPGDALLIVAARGGDEVDGNRWWYRVHDGARTGYISSSAVAAIDPLPVPWIAIATNDGDPSVGGVQAYRAPSLGEPMAASYRLGSRFTVLAAVAGDAVESSTSRWYRVAQGSLPPLYLYAAYLKFARLGVSVVPPPQITATAAVAMDRASGRILYRLEATRRLRPASTVKLMTALVALSRGKPEMRMIVPDDVYTVTADVGGSAMGLAPGEVLSLHDLLYGMLLPSGNDAAYTIAQNIGGSQRRFAALMNAQAAQLGLRDTHFTNSTGLDEVGEHTSAQDLARLSRYVLRKEVLVARIVHTSAFTIPASTTHPAFYLGTRNELLGVYAGADGVKTGTTDGAGQNLVASASRNRRRVLVVVLGATDRYADATALLDYAFAVLPVPRPRGSPATAPGQPGPPRAIRP